MRKYRPDNTRDNTINISLSCTPVDSGCTHFACAPPTAPGSTTTNYEEDDPNNPGQTISVSYTRSCTVSGLLGTGCKEWSVSGSMKIFNDLTRTAESVSQAAAAYGNPF